MSNIIITQRDLKQIKDWKVGERYVIQVEVTLKRLEETPYYGEPTQPVGSVGSKETIVASFDIESVQEVDTDKKAPYKKVYAAAMKGKVI